MSKRPSRDEVVEAILRLNLILARKAAALAGLAVAMTEATLAAHRLSTALQAADDREVSAFLFEHPDVIELDMADAWWRPEEGS